MSSALTTQQADLTLTILTGPDKDVSFQLVSTRVTIGRATDNSIVIKDLRCSRHHAVIEITPDGIVASNISSQTGIDVDGLMVKSAVLKSGSHITLGSTVIRFDVRPKAVTSNVPSTAPSARDILNSSLPQKKNNTMMIIIGVLVALALIIGGQQVLKKKADVDLRSDSAIDEEIKASQERKQALEKFQQQKGIGTPEYSEIQAMYLQGFRDYREGNYWRALQSFESVLALNPKHELAQKYRDLARRRQDEVVELTLVEAKRYMEQGKYSQALGSYQQAMILIRDTNNKRYQEALEYYRECELLMKGAY